MLQTSNLANLKSLLKRYEYSRVVMRVRCEIYYIYNDKNNYAMMVKGKLNLLLLWVEFAAKKSYGWGGWRCRQANDATHRSYNYILKQLYSDKNVRNKLKQIRIKSIMNQRWEMYRAKLLFQWPKKIFQNIFSNWTLIDGILMFKRANKINLGIYIPLPH